MEVCCERCVCVRIIALQAMRSNNTYVVREVLLSVDRLVRKYGQELQLLTWELIIDILRCQISHVQVRSISVSLVSMHNLLP